MGKCRLIPCVATTWGIGCSSSYRRSPPGGGFLLSGIRGCISLASDVDLQAILQEIVCSLNGAGFTVQAESLALTSLKPSSANQFTFSMTVEFSGSGFKPGATVRLKQGGNVINGWSVSVDSSSRIRANFGFFLVATGDYTAVVRNPDGLEVTLSGVPAVALMVFDMPDRGELGISASFGRSSITVISGGQLNLIEGRPLE